MTFLTAILPYAPILAIGPIAIGSFAIYVTRSATRRDRFITGWIEFSRSANVGRIARLVEVTERDLVFDAPTRFDALTVLSALEHLGRQAAARRADWEMVLPLDDHARIKTLITQCRPLIAVVRDTSVPLDVQCYIGHRKQAFANVTRAFR